MRIVLASSSLTRRRMLESAGVAFDAAAADIDEGKAKTGFLDIGFEARDVAEMLAQLKAEAVQAPGALVIGSDQTLELEDGTMLSKPGSREHALAQLKRLSGSTHRLHAAAAIAEGGEIVWRATETVTLTVRPLSEAFLHWYLDQEYEAIRWSVGGYRIEGLGAQLFESVEGSHFAVLGMPLLPLLAYLRQRGALQS